MQPREALGAGWLVVALVAVSVLLGSTEQASAYWPPDAMCCAGTDPGADRWCCTNYDCYGSSDHIRQHIQREANGPNCAVLDETCSCF